MRSKSTSLPDESVFLPKGRMTKARAIGVTPLPISTLRSWICFLPEVSGRHSGKPSEQGCYHCSCHDRTSNKVRRLAQAAAFALSHMRHDYTSSSYIDSNLAAL